MNILSKENKRAKKRGWNQNPPFPHLFSLLSIYNQLPPPQPEIAAVFLSYPARPGICLPEAQPKDLLRI